MKLDISSKFGTHVGL